MSRAVEIMDSLTFAADSLTIDNARLRALLELADQPAPVAGWHDWRIWSALVVGIAVGWVAQDQF